MPDPASATALNPGVRRREVFGWATYDFANSGYTTVVLTAVYNAYFVGVVAGNASWATLAWTSAMAVSSALVMLTSPALGAWADLRARKKRLLMLATALCVATTLLLAGTGPGTLALALVAVVLSNAFYAWSEALNAAFLPELARPEALGRVSGWGWAFGYCGGMLALGLGLAWVLHAQKLGQRAEQFVPVTLVITAVLYALAASVTFALLRERAQPQPGVAAAGLRASLARLAQTWHEARRYQDFRQLMLCVVAYNAGIAVVITLAAVYANAVLGFEQAEVMMLVFLVNIAAASGAFGWGYVQDRLGHRLALGATLVGWLVMIGLAAAAQGRPLFWAAAVMAGLCMGSSQSAGRALVGVLAPPARLAEFFGLWAFAVRLAAIIGPMAYGLVVWASGGNHRLGLASTALFFAVGLLLLRPLNVARGVAAARA